MIRFQQRFDLDGRLYSTIFFLLFRGERMLNGQEFEEVSGGYVVDLSDCRMVADVLSQIDMFVDPANTHGDHSELQIPACVFPDAALMEMDARRFSDRITMIFSERCRRDHRLPKVTPKVIIQLASPQIYYTFDLVTRDHDWRESGDVSYKLRLVCPCSDEEHMRLVAECAHSVPVREVTFRFEGCDLNVTEVRTLRFLYYDAETKVFDVQIEEGNGNVCFRLGRSAEDGCLQTNRYFPISDLALLFG